MNKIILRNNIHVEYFLYASFRDKIHKFHEWLSDEESYPSYQTVEHVLAVMREYRTIYRNLIEDNPEVSEILVDVVDWSLKNLRERLVPFVKEYKKGFIESGRQSWLM